MITVDIKSAKSADLRASMVALKRAADLARSVAIRTDTGIVIVRDNRLVLVSAHELAQENDRVAMTESAE